ncbi:hypothetical protein B0A55_06895 [Friedmanniomyces simplex]|uniref:serine C-palmitoyltransferase n=1 Tax=Friedmanniomyces simplex TaxID=329884 RepID=A0A4U0X8V7_9PEZI|nr:hypothetical protein B0A55_06895 [Friedmanniomyces simplex]
MNDEKEPVVVHTVSLSSSRCSTLDEHDEKQASHGQAISEKVTSHGTIIEPGKLSTFAKGKEFFAFAGGCLVTYAKDMPVRHKAVSRQGDFAHYVVQPWYDWFGRNKRVTTSQALSTITLQPCCGRPERPMINGGSFNYAGTYGMSADYDALHRKCLDTLPIPGAATPLVERALQEAVVGFWSADCCFITPTGYQSNILAFTAILENDWFVLMDQKSHSSMSTAAYLANAGGRKKFKHNDMRDLERLLDEVDGRYANVMVAVEGLYSLDGDLPDLAALHTLKARYDFVLCCDEAHSFMSLGKTGRGCLEWWNDTHPNNTVPVDLIDIRMTTLSKAVGGIGGLLSYVLRKHGVAATPFSKPAVPMWQSRVRIGMSAEFTDENVNQLVDALIDSCAETNLLHLRRPGSICSGENDTDARFKSQTSDAGLDEERNNVFRYLHDLIQAQSDQLAGPKLRDSETIGHASASLLPSVIEAGHRTRAEYGIVSALRGAETTKLVYDGLEDLVKTIRSVSKAKKRSYITLILHAQPTDSTAEVNSTNLIERLSNLRPRLKGLTILLDSTPIPHDQNAINIFSSTTLHPLASKLRARLLVFGSFYESLGLNGAYLAGDKALVDELRYTSRGASVDAAAQAAISAHSHWAHDTPASATQRAFDNGEAVRTLRQQLDTNDTSLASVLLLVLVERLLGASPRPSLDMHLAARTPEYLQNQSTRSSADLKDVVTLADEVLQLHNPAAESHLLHHVAILTTADLAKRAIMPCEYGFRFLDASINVLE